MSVQISIANSGEPVNTAFTGPTKPLLEELTRRRYNRHRSLLVDRWLAYSTAEGFYDTAADPYAGVTL